MRRLAAANTDQVRFSRPKNLGGVELLKAFYRCRSFPAHAHEEYVFGAMTAGCEILSIRGDDHLIDGRRLILISPGEVHSNRGATADAFGYAVMYVPAQMIVEAIAESTGCDSPSLPSFEQPAPAAPRLRSALLRTHAFLREANGPLAHESALLMFLDDVFRMRQPRRDSPLAATERQNLKRAREFLDAHFRDNFSLAHLAGIAGVSRFHLIRSFKRQMGLTPAAYHTQLRILAAKKLISNGCPIAQAAADVGFADQSHLTRHFQRIIGTTPGRYEQQ